MSGAEVYEKQIEFNKAVPNLNVRRIGRSFMLIPTAAIAAPLFGSAVSAIRTVNAGV